jgi:hypothetical protein
MARGAYRERQWRRQHLESAAVNEFNAESTPTLRATHFVAQYKRGVRLMSLPLYAN